LAGQELLAQVIGLVQADGAMERLLGGLEALVRLRRGPARRGGPLFQPLDLRRSRRRRLAVAAELGLALRRHLPGGAQLDGAVALALQQLVEREVVAGGGGRLPRRDDGLLLVGLRRLRRGDRRRERGAVALLGGDLLRPPGDGRGELLPLGQASDHLVQASQLRPQLPDRLAGSLRRLQRAGLRLPILLREIAAALRFLGGAGRRGGGGEGAGRFVEQRHEGRRARRRLDPRLFEADLCRLLLQCGVPLLDLAQLLRSRVQRLHAHQRGGDVVAPLPRRRQRLGDAVVLGVERRQGGVVDAGVLVGQHLAQRIDGALFDDRQALRLFPHALVDVEAQERPQHAAPVARRRLEKAGKLALRQHHGLHERGRSEAEDLHHPFRRGAHLVGQAVEGAAFVALFEADHLHAAAPQGAGDAVALGADVEVQHHADPVARRRDHLGAALDVDARDLAVEREDDRIEERRLAGPRRPGDREQLQQAEVDLLLVAEAGEPFDRQMDRTQR
jgi:hypothetical protein